MKEEYLIPVGNECLIPTRSEADIAFAAMGVFGEISLGLTEFKDPETPSKFYIGPKVKETFNCITWVCTEKNNKNTVWPAFEQNEDLKIYKTIKLHTKIEYNQMFIHKGMPYVLVHEKLQDGDYFLEDDIIKQVDFIADEKTVMYLAEILGFKPISAILQKLYVLKTEGLNSELKSNRKYLSVAWKIKCSNGAPIYAAAPVDNVLFDLYDFNTLDWEPISVGETFLRDGTSYILTDDENLGYTIVKSPMQIYR